MWVVYCVSKIFYASDVNWIKIKLIISAQECTTLCAAAVETACLTRFTTKALWNISLSLALGQWKSTIGNPSGNFRIAQTSEGLDLVGLSCPVNPENPENPVNPENWQLEIHLETFE